MTHHFAATPVGWLLAFLTAGWILFQVYSVARYAVRTLAYRRRLRDRRARETEDVLWQQHRHADAAIAHRLLFARYQHTLENEGGHHSLQAIS